MEKTYYIKYDTDSNTLAFRCQKNTFLKNTHIQIGMNQEVVILVDGKVKQVLSPGFHDLKLYNLNFKNILKGFIGKDKEVGNIDVWFVNQIKRVSIFWKLNSYTLFDCQTSCHVPVYAEGRSILSLAKSDKFISSLFVNSTNDFISLSDFKQLTTNTITSLIVKTINSYILDNNIPVSKLSENMNAVTEMLKGIISDKWSDYGMYMTGFEIGKIRILDNTDKSYLLDGTNGGEGFRLFNKEEKAVAEDAMVNAMRGGYGLYRSFNAATKYGKLFSNRENGKTHQSNSYESEGEVIDVYCHSCGTRFKSDESYCPKCGKKYNPCPFCGTDNEESAEVCYGCGRSLAGTGTKICPRCKSEIEQSALFCPKCGKPLKENI